MVSTFVDIRVVSTVRAGSDSFRHRGPAWRDLTSPAGGPAIKGILHVRSIVLFLA
jgi:hypothetical protein